MSNIKPIKINPELFKVSGSQNKNKTLKNKPSNPVKSNVLKKDLLARIRNHRSHKQNTSQFTNLDKNDDYDSYDTFDNNINTSDSKENIKPPSNSIQNLDNIPITVESNSLNKKYTNTDQDDDFLQSIDFLKTLSNKKNNTMKRKNLQQQFPLEKQDNLNTKPEYGCLKNGSLPTFREFHNHTVKRDNNDISESTLPKIKNTNKKNVTFKYNLGKKNKVVSVLIKNVSTRKKISNEHTRLKEIKLNDMKNYLKRHNLLKSGSNAPPDVIKKLYEQSLLSGDIRNTNKNSIVHNYLAE